MTVWIVWVGEWESSIESVWASEASARKEAHDLRQKGFDHVVVEEVEVKP